MADIELRNVRKAFINFVALEDLNLRIEDGEFVALLGPSGCGKSTTLRMLAGLEFPTDGEIRIGGKVVNDVAPGKRDIAMVFQSYALYPHMTVAQNIAYPLKKRGVDKAERDRKVERAAALLHLEPLLSRKPKQLSGGQQQRVALGRALVREPEVFLLDEPLSNLDAKLRSYMRIELIELHRQLGKTMVYVTHDQLEAMTMAHRIAVMNGGKLQQFDTPDAIYNRPANLFVADFIGTPSMNLMEGSLSGSNFTVGGQSVTIDRSRLKPETTDGAAVLGVRPEDIMLGDGTIDAVVELVENTGHEKIVALAVKGCDRILARAPSGSAITVGEAVKIGFDQTKTHLFEKDGEGRRLNLDQDHNSLP
ncbi:ABC transporter ATP-binding protein [Oricola sp.]|uniref:ABC transporter ATP-binding protein n=1 Tax=Oricola sp. TaxID=1979950 RepID=UPI0025EB0A7B|nr:ABC transporter ATP-binding protein [Oricola sp.]MCI5076606.1 ABC transporter ATP-binding protein [Oricola sp.]